MLLNFFLTGQEKQIGPWPVSPAILLALGQVTPGQNEGVSAASDVIAQGEQGLYGKQSQEVGACDEKKRQDKKSD